MDACDDKVICASNRRSLRPSGTQTFNKYRVFMCVPITQSGVNVKLIASFVRHSNLVGSQLILFGSKDHELHFNTLLKII